MGVSIEVASLQTARSLLEANTKRQFERYAGPYGQSILIPPEFTHGVWIEFFQKWFRLRLVWLLGKSCMWCAAVSSEGWFSATRHDYDSNETFHLILRGFTMNHQYESSLASERIEFCFNCLFLTEVTGA